ncbi:MAG TPA: arginine--tRNA ligase [Candidatus Paceibacterota bacterium]|nr:arginine--tRNA ligase [Candidatus Paceibacterota bacterium]
MIRESIEQAVKAALAELGAGDAPFVVSRPGDMAHGDYATNAALSAAKALKKNPREVAEMLVAKLTGPSANPLTSEAKQPGLASGPVEKIEVAGAGFINFFLSSETIKKEVADAAQGEGYGANESYAGKTIMVEYTDPNPFKEFHIGHLMSNAIGESIARLLERSGAKVLRANYQGDVGPHVAKALYILLEKNIDNPSIKDISAAYVEGASRYEENAEDKKAIDALNKKIYEKSDERVNALYEKGRTLTLEHFEELYKILGTKFDFYFFESAAAPIGVKIVHAHPDVFVESEGATVFKGEGYGLHTRVFLNSQGLPTYEAKELGLMELKKEKAEFDESITITASEQSDFFKVVYLAAKLISPDLSDKLVHRSHGMMRFASGKMSSRLGNVVTGESLLRALTDAAKEKMKERDVADAGAVAERVAVAAVKYAVLKQGTGKDIVFDPEKSLSLEGDSGPYLQYAHVRACSLLKKADGAEDLDSEASPLLPPAGESKSSAPVSRQNLERLILHYPDALARAAEELEPHHVTTYLIELASAFNSWYASERLIVDGKVSADALALVKAVKNILASGLDALGIAAPEQM